MLTSVKTVLADTLETDRAVRDLTAHFGATEQGAHAVAKHSQAAAATARDSAHSLEEIARATDALGSTSRKSADSADLVMRLVDDAARDTEEARALAEGAAQRAEEGERALAAVGVAFESVQTSVTAAVDLVEGAAARAQEMDGVAMFLDELLAELQMVGINASIMAAQLEGQGFHVIAQHVRGLSQRTSSSVKDIVRLIDSLRDAVDGARDAMRRTHAAALSSRGAIEAADLHFGEIRAATASARDVLARIALSSAEISRTSKEQASSAAAVEAELQGIRTSVGEARSTLRGLEELSRALRGASDAELDSIARQSEALGRIARAAESSRTAAENLDRSHAVQLQRATDVHRSFLDVQRRSEEQRRLAGELTAAITLVSEQAALLTGEVSRFRIDGENRNELPRDGTGAPGEPVTAPARSPAP